MQDFCPLKIKITQFPGGFPLYLTHCKNHREFSIAFERYCSEVDLQYENFKWLTSTFVHILKNCPEKWVNSVDLSRMQLKLGLMS